MDDPVLCGREIRGIAAVLPPELDEAELATKAGLAMPLADLPLEQCTDDAVQRLWRAILSATDDPTVPFVIGTRLPFGTYEIIDYLTSVCATAGEAFVRLAKYFGLVTHWFRWSCDADAADPIVYLDAVDGSPEEHLVFVQYILGVAFGRFHDLVDAPFECHRVDVALPPLPPTAYERFFGCPVTFGAERTAIVVTRASWSAPLKRSEAGLQQVLEAHAQTLIDRVRPPDGLAPVRVAVQRSLADGAPSLEDVAKAVKTSTRTLQRRLKDAGTSFQSVVDEERAAAALTYLADRRMAIGEIAYSLGYSEPSAFVRAFRRWTGETPNDYRARTAG